MTQTILGRVALAISLIGVCGMVESMVAQTAPSSVKGHGPTYRIVNQTEIFTDDQIFWSLDHGKQWHQLRREPTPVCPLGNGRLYFCLGTPPKNFDARNAYWDFVEYASENSETWHGNTTQVDAFCIPITIEMADKKVGLVESHATLLERFRNQAPEAFRSCVRGDAWIVSPCRATFGAEGVNAHYFDAYIDEIWTMYATERKTPSGLWIGKVVEGALTFTPVAGGKPITCPRKPSTQDAFLGTGVLATNAPFCAAINRHVLADPADWKNPARFYQSEPCNWYAKFFHEQSLGKKAYGFCYDDVAEQAAFFSAKGKEVVITLRWGSKPR